MEIKNSRRIDKDNFIEENLDEISESWKCLPKRVKRGYKVKEIREKDDFEVKIVVFGRNIFFECSCNFDGFCRHTASVYQKLGYMTASQSFSEEISSGKDQETDLIRDLEKKDDNWDIKKKHVERQRKKIKNISGR